MKWTPLCLLIIILAAFSKCEDFKRGLTSGIDKPLNQIFAPLDVPCTVSVCDGPLSGIYCHGPILTNAWQFGLEKTCPGDKLRVPASKVLENFGNLQYPLKRDDFEAFCEENFEQKAYLEVVDLQDWNPNATFLSKIHNPKYKKLAQEIHNRWNRLARRFTDDVIHNIDLYPLLPVKNPFIAPGGRFDVYFYWDTYWIVKGLLISEMHRTAKGIIDNFANLVVQLGYIPNSGNLQLTRRSQPPLFAHMVWEYSKSAGKIEHDWIKIMEKEIQFWEANRIVTLEEGGHQMFVYKADTNCPRPENFLSDFNLGIKKPNPSQVWKSISSACESGWDFSSRWMRANSTTDLSSIHTDQIIPVDLNVIIATNYWIIANLSASLNRESDTSYYQEKHTKLLEAINKVLWDEEHGAWFDFDILANKKNFNFYPSNVYPLMIPGFNHYKYSDRVANYVQKSGVLQFTGGIPSSLPATSSQQWDFPNVWAPNQHFVIQSFLASNNSFLEQEAVKQAEKFIESVYNGLYQSEPGKEAGIWEKYDARSSSGAPGAGGEYVVQEGFGWTNGAVLDLIWTFNSKLKSTRHLELGLTREQHAGLVYTAAGFCAIVALVTLLKGICKKRQCIESNDDAEAAQSLLATENEEEDDL